MKAFILAAGLGTRLKPWTETHPKALVPVAGVPMLERVICRLKSQGFTDIVINVHHFADQIIDFVNGKDFGVNISISDESAELLDTGGGLLAAAPLLTADSEPVLVHNVDILSDALLAEIMRLHKAAKRDISLVTSLRESSRKLVFDGKHRLIGWHNLKTNQYRPEGFVAPFDSVEHAFSGIYAVNVSVFGMLEDYAKKIGSRKFPIMDFLLDSVNKHDIDEIEQDSLNLIDIGKSDTLLKAQELVGKISNGNGAPLCDCEC